MTILYDNATAHDGGFRDIDPVRVAHARGSVRLIDVREPSEFTGDLGHAPGAELVPLGTLQTAATTWDREQELVLICRSGKRSQTAASVLVGLGFQRPMNMTGGMLAWQAAQLLVER